MISNRAFIAAMLLPLLVLGAYFGLVQYERHYAQDLAEVPNDSEVPLQKQHDLVTDVRGLLQVYYDGEMDTRTLLNGSLQGMANSLGDQYTQVLLPVEAREQSEDSSGSYSGIGVTITAQSDGTLRVNAVFKDGPASQAGVKMGDRIVAAREVGGDGEWVSLKGKTLDGARELIKGEADSVVELRLVRPIDSTSEESNTITLEVTRGSIPMQTVQGTRMIDPELGIGYARISNFALTTPDQLLAAVDELRETGMRSLVLDLRNNGGGVLTAATRISDMFIKEEGKTIVSIKSSEEKLARLKKLGVAPDELALGQSYGTADDVAEISVPTVVLMNGASASASEILAGALQDYDLAFIVGTESFGKGVVQRPIALPSDPNYQIKITIASYYTPLGNNLHRKTEGGPGGITPDLNYPMSSKEQEEMARRFALQAYDLPSGEESFIDEQDKQAWNAPDPQLEAALSVLRGVPVAVPFTRPAELASGEDAEVLPDEADERDEADETQESGESDERGDGNE